ncbi:PREDICTED: myb-like protein AA [Vollenhovia emeryi]|uniref:myb-like protein AA n=1 Tax=Vollenhovia emeryi TaxID=411798 RepID=UPI0005F3E0C4|nr:PREDICTED: myb-like protein AA [Vollenhovia emeryi]
MKLRRRYMQTLGVSVKQLRRKLLELGARILHVQGSKPRDMALVMLSVSQGMEVGSSGRGASAEDDPTAGAVGGGVGGGGGGDGDEARRRRDLQAVMIAAARDRAIRAESVRHDLALNLPPRLELPDGEEHPYGAHPDLHLRNPEQESEIYQKCVRAPPNRTVFDSESPPPYRTPSSSQHLHSGLLDMPGDRVTRSQSPSSSNLLLNTARSMFKMFPSHTTPSSTSMPVNKPPFSSYSESSSNVSSNLSSSNLSNITVVPCETDESRQEQQQQQQQQQQQPQQQQQLQQQPQQQQFHQKV